MQCRKLISIFSLFFIFEVNAIEIYQVGLIESYPWAYKTESNAIKGVYPELFYDLEKNITLMLNFRFN